MLRCELNNCRKQFINMSTQCVYEITFIALPCYKNYFMSTLVLYYFHWSGFENFKTSKDRLRNSDMILQRVFNRKKTKSSFQLSDPVIPINNEPSLKSFQERQSCSREVYCICNNDWFTQTLLIKTESENNQKKNTGITSLHSFLSPHEQDIAFIIVFYICTNLLMTLQHECTVITNDIALVTMIFFFKRAWQSWGTIIFMILYANTTFHLLTTNLEKHLVSLDAQFPNISSTCPHHDISPFFLWLLNTGRKFSSKSFSISFTLGWCTCHGTLLISSLWPWWVQIVLLLLLHLQKHL